MESATKNKQTREEIINMVQKAFGDNLKQEEITISELTEGLYNVAYEVILPDKSVILKVAPQADAKVMSYERNIMQAEVEGLRLVKKLTQVPVPEIFFYDNSKSVCNAEYFFMEKIEGDSLYKLKNVGMPEEECQQILTETGRYNRSMNSIEGTCYGYIGQPEKQGSDWREVFLEMINEVLADGERIEISLGVEYEEVRKLIDKASFALDQVTKPVFVHWDLWEGNVFIKDGKVSGLIDFERAFWGDPLMEYNFRGYAHNEHFIKGYGEDLRAKAPIRALLYDMYLYLIMVIETKYRNYQDDWQYNFATKELNTAMASLRNLL